MPEKAPSQRERSKEARRQKIVTAARSVFYERGYGAATMSQIASLVGGSKSTLWALYPSKEALFAAVIKDGIAEFQESLGDVLKAGCYIHDSLHTFGAQFAIKLMSPSSIRLSRIIAGEGERFPELGVIFFKQVPAPVIARLTQYLIAEMEQGHLLRTDPMQAAQQLVLMLQGSLLMRIWQAPTLLDMGSVLDYAASCIDMFLCAHASGKMARTQNSD